MDTLWTVGNAVLIRDPQTGMPVDHLVGELMGADVEATPALGIGDEARDSHWPFYQRRQWGANGDILPVARLFATDRLVLVQGVNAGKLFLGVHLWRPVLDLLVLGAGFAGEIAIGAKAPGVGTGKLVARFIVEVDMIDLLDGTAGKARVMLDEVFEIRAGRNLGIAVDGFRPGEGTAGKHRVYA